MVDNVLSSSDSGVLVSLNQADWIILPTADS